MMYTREDMRQLLIDAADVDPQTIDVAIALAGDTNETYKKLLTLTTSYRTYIELENYWDKLVKEQEEIYAREVDNEEDD